MLHTTNRGPDLRPIRRRRLLIASAVALVLTGCGKEADLVVRVSVDQVFSEELVRDFERETGLRVRAQYDIEQSKTVGHVNAILAEHASGRPRTDVFWNNEIAQTIRLAEAGLLAVYDSPAAADIPEAYRDPERRWTGFAARVRVLIADTRQVEPDQVHGTLDLFAEAWRGKAGIAVPLTGTTLTHATALYQVMGEEWAREFFAKVVAENAAGRVNLPNSNGQSMTLTKAGELAWAWTDTDDYNVARIDGASVARIYPDQVEAPGTLMKDGQPVGALVIPNTVMLLKDAPRPEAAKRFIDWLLRPEVEARLAASRSAQIPVRESVPRPPEVGRLGDFRAMQVDYVALGKDIGARAVELTKLFNR